MEDTHTYIYWFVELHLEFPHDQVLGKNASTVKVWFSILASTLYLPSQYITSRTLTWLCTFFMVSPKIALFINLNKFFSNSFFAKVLKFVLNSMYS